MGNHVKERAERRVVYMTEKDIPVKDLGVWKDATADAFRAQFVLMTMDYLCGCLSCKHSAESRSKFLRVDLPKGKAEAKEILEKLHEAKLIERAAIKLAKEGRIK